METDNNILNDVKRSIGLMPEYDSFDQVLIMHINSVFMILHQMGVGPDSGFRLVTGEEVWTDFLPSTYENFESVKSYVGMKVRLLFDPPSSSTHMECIKQAINEFEWRLNFEAEVSK